MINEKEFISSNLPVATYSNNFGRRFANGCHTRLEINTPVKLMPANAQLFFELGISADMKGNDDTDEMTIIYKDNHGAPGNKEGKYNVIVILYYKSARNGQPASYIDEVRIGFEDDHDDDPSIKDFKGVKYQNRDILLKYNPIDKLIQGRGSYQDTNDGGVRYVLEFKDPETNEWKKIFDHVDYGDEHHDIVNYRGASAFRSSIIIYGDSCLDSSEYEEMENLERKPITIEKSDKQKRILRKLGYCNITFKEISPDNNRSENVDDLPLSFGKKKLVYYYLYFLDLLNICNFHNEMIPS
jgi:hypothetical protein